MAPEETFNAEERQLLAPFVTSLERPVFALRNLPQVTMGALFARYSRYPGTLRRLMLDEFGEDLEANLTAAVPTEGSRAQALYERVFLGYGDDSVAQLGGAHVACEWVSNVMTKVLQRPRLGAYLEQSTRYIAYDRPMPGGGYRYYRSPELSPAYEVAMDSLFQTYSELLPQAAAWAAEVFPPDRGESPQAHERAVRAKALDLTRGLLPAASLSHVGIFASGQTYESLILHLLANALPEARLYGELILAALQATMPSFVARVERPDRGGRWIEFLAAREAEAQTAAERFGLSAADREEGPSVRLLRSEGSEAELLEALLFEACGVGEGEIASRLAGIDPAERAAAIATLAGPRSNRRHRPGRGFEALRYRFEIISDYGAFRDLQRHRMLTVQWQNLGPHLGAEVPEGIEAAGGASAYERALDRSQAAWTELVAEGHALLAPYALCLAYRIRYVLDLNAREAIHLIELRSGREGHPSYRAIAQEMHRQIAAVHPAVGAAMGFLDSSSEPRLERLLAEIRGEARRSGAEQGEQ